MVDQAKSFSPIASAESLKIPILSKIEYHGNEHLSNNHPRSRLVGASAVCLGSVRSIHQFYFLMFLSEIGLLLLKLSTWSVIAGR
jgi:hypothetical protein